MLLCWSPKLNWMPRKPTFMFTICQNGNRGRFVILSSEQSVGRQRNAAVPRSQEARAVVSPDGVHELAIDFDRREVIAEHEVAAFDDRRGRNRMTDSDGFECPAAVPRRRGPDIEAAVGV